MVRLSHRPRTEPLPAQDGFAAGWRRLRDVVVIAGGGTGGHLYPGLVLGRAIRRTCRALVVVIGRDLDSERATAHRYGLLHIGLPVRGLRRRLGWQTVESMIRFAATIPLARRILLRLRPCVVIGMGGYASAPALLAAHMLGIPLLLHEQNAIPGRVTRWFASHAHTICLTFGEAQAQLPGRCVTTGLPIRPETVGRRDERAYAAFGLDPNRFTVLVTGGSQGAMRLCRTVVALEPQLSLVQRPFQVLLIAGRNNYAEITSQSLPSWIVVRDYVEEMGLAYAVADLVVARAGASTIAEIESNAKPSILIPLAIAADDHQRANAQVLAARGGCKLLEEADLSPAALAAAITGLLDDPKQLAAMAQAVASNRHRTAAARMVGLIRPWLQRETPEVACA